MIPEQKAVQLEPAAELSVLMAAWSGVAGSLLMAHTSDHLGYCRGCELPQAGPMRWPCTLVHLARAAARIERSRQLPGVRGRL